MKPKQSRCPKDDAADDFSDDWWLIGSLKKIAKKSAEEQC